MADFLPIVLPSRCRTYVDENKEPIKPETVLVRPYQGSDQIYLTQINPLNLERNYFEVLKSIVKGIDPLQLTVGDRMYIILWEYINSYNKMMKVKTICSNCLSEVEVNIDLTTLEKVELPEDYMQPQTITLPVSGDKVNVRLLTVEDEIEAEKFMKKHKKEGLLYRYARTIVDDKDVLVRMNKLSTMEAKDFMKIMFFQDKFFHGPVLKTTFTCPIEDCGEEDEVEVPFRLDFFFPDVSELSDIDGERI